MGPSSCDIAPGQALSSLVYRLANVTPRLPFMETSSSSLSGLIEFFPDVHQPWQAFRPLGTAPLAVLAPRLDPHCATE
ncbi:hypothetical protein EYF80_024749 [Liparis tanakae]|uniref:Uncharacterized protein n=1 Tax=Liparis tanakae TaxID=230148 RepID=A0A4Z2HHJ8_9TELE|nr:hypothetical protein EYF80_024749 [Liparis tanakae]